MMPNSSAKNGKLGHYPKVMLFSILHVSVLQIMDSPDQLSEGTKPNSIFPLLEVSYRALG